MSSSAISHPPSPIRGRFHLAVIGSASCDQDVAALAEDVGRAIARHGAVLVCGGRGGVMEAACRGARAEGGTTIGILPGSSREEANAYVEYPVATGLGEARNAVVVGTADAVIAVRGGHGTLSEIGLALKMGRPVVGLDTWVLRDPGQGAEALVRASGADEAVEKALALAGQGSAGERG